jgi:hypothetical protein
MRFAVLSLAVLSIQALSAGGYSKYKGLWLEVSKESAPAGATAQVHITLTEPKPIIRTRVFLAFEERVVESIQSVAILSENGEATGAAVRFGNLIRIDAASPNGTLGMTEESPLFSIAVKLRADAPEGESAIFRILPESTFYEPDGDLWTVEDNAPGSVTVGGDLSIDSIVPAGGLVEAGKSVRILGRGFEPWSRVEIDGEPQADVRFVSSTELEFTAASDFQLDRRKVRVLTKSQQSRSFITNFLGVEHAQSLYDLVAAAQPLFSHRAATTAAYRLGHDTESTAPVTAVALQNPGTDAVAAWVEVVGKDGQTLGAGTVVLLAGERSARTLDEIIPGVEVPSGATLRISASSPLQMVALSGDLVSGSLQPLAPEN